MKKKILLYLDGMDSGGAQRQMLGLAKCLTSTPEFETKLLFYKKNADFYVPYLKKYGISYVYDPGLSKLHGFFALIKQIKDFKPNLIISFLGKNNLFASANRIICNIPLIVSERNTTTRLSKADRLRFLLYRWADKIIANSYSQTNYLKTNHQILTDKVFTIPNFVDTEHFYPSLNKKNDGVINIAIVARVVPQKNALGLIKSLRRVVDVKGNIFHVDWVGNTDNKRYVSECKTLLRDLNLTNAFSFVGEKSDILSVYQKSDALCLPSFFEGTPNVLCEAMACGLPILCSKVCDNPINVQENLNGYLFDPNDVNSISAAFIRFFNNSTSNLKIISKNNRERAVERFSVSSFNSAWLKQICQLI